MGDRHPSPVAMTGRVCVVTGATRGIGRATAERLAELGATLVLVCRRREDGDRVATALAHLPAPRADVVVADLASQQAIREAAGTIRARHPRLHVLVNNAGLIPREREVTVDGLEMQLAVNHLAPFLLTNLLVDRLAAGAPARVVSVSPGTHPGGTIDNTPSKSGAISSAASARRGASTRSTASNSSRPPAATAA